MISVKEIGLALLGLWTLIVLGCAAYTAYAEFDSERARLERLERAQREGRDVDDSDWPDMPLSSKMGVLFWGTFAVIAFVAIGGTLGYYAGIALATNLSVTTCNIEWISPCDYFALAGEIIGGLLPVLTLVAVFFRSRRW